MREMREDPERFIEDSEDDEALQDTFCSLKIGGKAYPELRYADDTVLMSTTPEGLEKMIKATKKHSENQNLYLNAKKTKIMKTDKSKKEPYITIDNEAIENVQKFEYLGSMITSDGDVNKEIKRRLAIATKKLKQMKKLWQGTDNATK